MNRAQRRQTERDIKRRINRTDRIVPLPAMFDEFTVFDMPQSIIDQLKNGSIDAVNDTPAFRDNTGNLCEVVPALEGWIFTWKKLSNELDLFLSFYSLSLLSECLQKGDLITKRYIINAANELQACRIAFRNSDRQKICSIAKTAQIQLMLGH